MENQEYLSILEEYIKRLEDINPRQYRELTKKLRGIDYVGTFLENIQEMIDLLIALSQSDHYGFDDISQRIVKKVVAFDDDDTIQMRVYYLSNAKQILDLKNNTLEYRKIKGLKIGIMKSKQIRTEFSNQINLILKKNTLNLKNSKNQDKDKDKNQGKDKDKDEK